MVQLDDELKEEKTQEEILKVDPATPLWEIFLNAHHNAVEKNDRHHKCQEQIILCQVNEVDLPHNSQNSDETEDPQYSQESKAPATDVHE